jgi:hypothetical protein
MNPMNQEEIQKLVALGYDRPTAEAMALVAAGTEDQTKPVKVDAGQRIMGVLFGIFLMCFGLPFILLPLSLWMEVGGSFDFNDIMLIVFPLPFIMAGGFVMFMGINLMRLAIKGEATMSTGTHAMNRAPSYQQPSYTSREELLAQIHQGDTPTETASPSSSQTGKNRDKTPPETFWGVNED